MLSKFVQLVTVRSIVILYPYECPKCDASFEVIKSVKMIDDEERCPKCDTVAERKIAKQQSFYGASDWDTAHYNPAFGKVVKSNKEARELAKKKGMIEVGNEDPDKIEKEFAKDRAKKAEYKSISELTSLGEIRS